MTDIQDIPQWATSGTKTSPSSGLYGTGYEGGSQPAGPNFNYLTNNERTKTNELVDEANLSRVERYNGNDGVSGYDAIVKKYYPRGSTSIRSLPTEAINKSTDISAKITSLCLYVDSVGARSILALDSTDGAPQVHLIPIEGVPAIDSSSGNLSGDLPSGGSQSWQATSMTSDGVNVFIILQDTNANPNETHQIQAWDIAEWGVKSGWVSTGTTLPGTGTVDIDIFESQVIIATSTQLATANSWAADPTASTDDAVSIITIADGTLEDSGAGDHPGAGSLTGSANRIASDGTFLYCVASLGKEIWSVEIDDPNSATGNGQADIPYSIPGDDRTQDIICIGRQIIANSDDYDAAPLIVYLDVTYGLIGLQYSGVDEVYESGGSLCTDGSSLWSLGTVDRGTVSRPAVFKNGFGHATWQSVSVIGTGPAIEYTLKDTYTYWPQTHVTGKELAPICFDGDNIWFIGDGGTPATESLLYRIAKATDR